MKVIVDLIEAYSDHMGLPVTLTNLNGEIEYKTDEYNYLLPIYNSISSLIEFRNVAQQINKPTIISVSEELSQSNHFYIITPIFKVNNSKKFLIVGPFYLESKSEKNMSPQNNRHLPILNDKDLEKKIKYMKILYQLIVNKAEVDTSFSVPEQIITVLEKLGDFDGEIVDSDDYISCVMNELIKIETLDFLGIASRNEDDVFIIRNICGESVQHLVNEKFYIGEGLLGKAVILGEDFYWSKDIDSIRAEFFNKFGIFPKHLFGFTLKKDEVVNAVIFGGSFNNTIISENLLKLMKFITYLIYQKNKLNRKLIDSYYLQSIFANWLDLMDIVVNVKDRKYIFYKILDFCQTLNNGKFACFTTVNNEFIYRGKKRDDIVQLHYNQLANIFSERSAKLWINHPCIHFSLEFDFQIYGLFTVEFEENTDLQQIAYILHMINELLKRNADVSLNNESIFDLLHTSMQEMNSHQYYLSNLSMNFAKKIFDTFQISSSNKKLILNICKVFPYPFEYLKKQIGHTKEWGILLETQDFIQRNKITEDDCSIEVKILAYTYIAIIKRQNIESVRFLNSELKAIFTKVYNSLLESIEQEGKKEEIDFTQIEELTDLKSVISTLGLTLREKEILHLILEGLNNQEVADYLKISHHTVKNHITSIFKKLNVSDRIQAMAKIYRIKYGE